MIRVFTTARTPMSKSWLALLNLLLITATICSALLWTAPLSAKSPPPPMPGNLRQNEIPIALLVDASNGQVLFKHQSNRRFVPASITKVMTLYTAFQLIEEGKLDLKRPLIVSTNVWEEWGGQGSTMYLNAGDEVSLPDILTGIANVSANDASVVLAEQAAGSVAEWAALMNKNARLIGMTQSHFATPNGWPDEGRTFTTAQDLVRLARALISQHPDKFARYIGQRKFSYGGITQTNHDPMLGRVEGADGIKTGYTNEAGFGFLGTAKRGGQRLILVVAGGNQYGGRARAARSLMEWGFANFDRRPLFPANAKVGEVQVQNGSAGRVTVTTPYEVSVNVPKGRRDDLEMRIIYDGPLHAPIAKGEQVATLEITAPDMATARVPLLAQNAISEASLLDRIFNGFTGWFS